MLTFALVHHCPRFLHHLCHLSASCYCAMPEDRSSNIPGSYYTCLGSSYGKTTVSVASGADADIFQIGMGFPKTWETMIPLRMLLGLLEAGFFPGCVYLLSISLTRSLSHSMLIACQVPGTADTTYRSDILSST